MQCRRSLAFPQQQLFKQPYNSHALEKNKKEHAHLSSPTTEAAVPKNCFHAVTRRNFPESQSIVFFVTHGRREWEQMPDCSLNKLANEGESRRAPSFQSDSKAERRSSSHDMVEIACTAQHASSTFSRREVSSPRRVFSNMDLHLCTHDLISAKLLRSRKTRTYARRRVNRVAQPRRGCPPREPIRQCAHPPRSGAQAWRNEASSFGAPFTMPSPQAPSLLPTPFGRVICASGKHVHS